MNQRIAITQTPATKLINAMTVTIPGLIPARWIVVFKSLFVALGQAQADSPSGDSSKSNLTGGIWKSGFGSTTSAGPKETWTSEASCNSNGIVAWFPLNPLQWFLPIPRVVGHLENPSIPVKNSATQIAVWQWKKISRCFVSFTKKCFEILVRILWGRSGNSFHFTTCDKLTPLSSSAGQLKIKSN